MIPSIIAAQCKGFFPQERSWCHLDWLSLSGAFAYCAELHRDYNARFNKLGLGWRKGRGTLAYSESLSFPERGLRLLWSDFNAPNNKGWGLLEISGKFFESHGIPGFQWLMKWCEPRTLRCTRLDIANNLFHKGAVIEPLQKGLEAGDYVPAGGKRTQNVCSMQWQGAKSVAARTLYIGSRQSPTFSRIYDALAIHAPEFTLPKDWYWTRYEMELKAEYSNRLYQDLIKSLEGAPVSLRVVEMKLKAYASGFLARHQVQIKNSGDRSSRRSPCLEWQRLSRASFKFRQRALRPEVSRERTIRWLQFGGALNLILAMEIAFGSEILSRLKHSFFVQKLQTDWRIWDKIKSLAAELQRPPSLIGGSDCQTPDFCQC